MLASASLSPTGKRERGRERFGGRSVAAVGNPAAKPSRREREEVSLSKEQETWASTAP
jgi:hypothetical protein